jgi:hypothetical protein
MARLSDTGNRDQAGTEYSIEKFINNKMKIATTLFFLALVTVAANAQHDHSSHSPKTEQGKVTFQDADVNTAYGHYIHLKDALVSSNADEAKKAAKELQQSLSQLTNGKKASAEASKVVIAADLDGQRMAFGQLSDEMTSLVKNSKLSEGTLYVEYCPMANHNQGGLWLSNEKEIKNPYFGDMMLKCGSVKETIQ